MKLYFLHFFIDTIQIDTILWRDYFAMQQTRCKITCIYIFFLIVRINAIKNYRFWNEIEIKYIIN